MPFARPTLAELLERTRADVESRLPGTDPRLRRSMLGVLARIQAGASHQVLGYLDWIARQVFPDTAEAEELSRWAAIWGVPRLPAGPAAGSVAATGTPDTVIPAGTVWQRSDGALFASAADATLVAGAATVALTAQEAGAAGNTAAGSTLTLATPLAGVTSTGLTTAGLTGGADEEDDERLRARLLDRIQQPPHGGAFFDYEAWALSVPGITRAWVRPLYLGPGTVGIYVVADESTPIIPTQETIDAVQGVIDLVRPVTADVTVFAPVPVALDLTLRVYPDTAAVRAAVAAEVSDFLYREAAPGATILLSRLRESISSAAGEYTHEIQSPVLDVHHQPGQIAALGTLTWAS